MEDKCFHIFPYEQVMQFEGEDYKGYPKYLKCTTIGLDIREINAEYQYRIIIVATLLISRYGGFSDHLDQPVQYIHSLVSLCNDLPALEATNSSTSLAVMNNTQLINLNESAILSTYTELITHLSDAFTSANVKSGELAEKFNSMRSACYTSVNQDLVEAFGQGFEIDPTNVLRYDTKLLITSNDSEALDICTSEYVGTTDRIELEMYRQYRQQLADYIQEEMDKCYQEAGGLGKIRAWYKGLLYSQFDKLVKLAVSYYHEIASGQRKNSPYMWSGIPISQEIVAGYTVHEIADWSRSGHEFVLNPEKGSTGMLSHRCPISGCNATIWMQIQPCTLSNLITIVGEDVELPKILTGWRNTSSNNGGVYTGNHILSSCDPVSLVRHPLIDGLAPFDFSFTIGLSKKGINKMMKEMGLPPIPKSVETKSESL